MNDQQRRTIFQLFTGTLICQELLIQLLHRKGLVRKKEVADGLDRFIEFFEKKGADQIAVPMKYLRKNIGSDASARPMRREGSRDYPAWFQGVIQGGRAGMPDGKECCR